MTPSKEKLELYLSDPIKYIDELECFSNKYLHLPLKGLRRETIKVEDLCDMNTEPNWDKLYQKWAKEKEDFKNMSYTERLEVMLKAFCHNEETYNTVIDYCKNGVNK